MQPIKLILFCGYLFLSFICNAQNRITVEEADIKSYALYEKADWKGVLTYGKKAIAAGQDFTLLRMRMGYAAFMSSNFSEALKQYQVVLSTNPNDTIAHYYSYYCRLYLNQTELSAVHARYLSDDLRAKEKIEKLQFTKIGVETSYKITDINIRENALYSRLHAEARLGWKVNMSQSIALYNQNINEPNLIYVNKNNLINIRQKEYYNKLTFNLNNRWQLKAAYHYLYTPFNNLIYNNNIGLMAIRYNHNYFNLQATAMYGKITDTLSGQLDLMAEYYPFGNLNLYGYSVVNIRNRNQQTAYNFKQVIGCKILENLWIEGNATLGSFSNLLENDALYVYNSIDPNQVKAGLTLYLLIKNHLQLQTAYTFEQRIRYNTNYLFYQQSLTAGISWKF